MTDHTNPQWLRSVGETREHLMNVMHVGLSRKGDVSTKAAALADDIRALGEARKAIGEASFFIEQLCAVVVYAATQIPPDGLWQDIFVRTMQNVQQTEGDYYDEDRESDEEYQSDEDSDEGYESDGDDEPYEDDEPDEDDEQFDDVEFLDWKYLPQLWSFMLDRWFDPTTFDDWKPEDVSRWENLNSFAARFKTDTFPRWFDFPIWALREALEEKLDKGPILNSRLWIATEWIIFYGESLFKDQASQKNLSYNTARFVQGGSLCQGIKPLSLARLAFWKNRLLEMLDEREALGLSDEMAERVAKSAEMIGEFQSRQAQ